MNSLEMFKRINTFKDLKKDWDGDGSDPISPSTICLALSLVNSLSIMEDWFVAPCQDGSILFESDSGCMVSVYKCEDE